MKKDLGTLKRKLSQNHADSEQASTTRACRGVRECILLSVYFVKRSANIQKCS